MYNILTAKLKNIYNTTCSVTVSKQKLVRKLPWITNSLKQACKKKNLLYRQFLKKRSTASEERYNKYKNKLTGILRYCAKKPLYRASRKNKGNIKGTCKIINCLINKISIKELLTQHNLIAMRPKSRVVKILANCFNICLL